MVWAAVLAVLGWRVAAAFAAPLAYLIFLVPFGEFTVPALQRLTAWQIELLLGLTDIPFYIDDLVIEIPAGTFLVAEACAGLRFLIAALAFGALYAFVMFRNPWRRVLVMVLALTVPLVANGFRGFGLVMLGHYQGSAAAVDADHILYGWVFFSIVILLLILAGLPFRQDGEDLSPVRFPSRAAKAAPAGLAAAALGVGLLAASGPVAAGLLDRGVTDMAAAVPGRLAVADRCQAGPEAGSLICGDLTITARLIRFDSAANWSRVSAERLRAYAAGNDVDFIFGIAMPGAQWLARQPQEGGLIVATASWLAGRPAGDGIRSRAAQAWNALRGGADGAPVLAIVTARGAAPGDRRDRELLRHALEAQQDGLVAQAQALSRGSAPVPPPATPR
jgi:exosortase/archaeosortase family protein